MVLVTRSDLKLSRGKLAAQCGHAVAECVLKAKREQTAHRANLLIGFQEQLVIEVFNGAVQVGTMQRCVT